MYTKDWFERWATYSPDKVAVEEYEPERTVTYAKINKQAAQLANYFKVENINKGDRVMLLGEHSIEMVVVFAAALKTGVIIVPINFRLAPAEIDYLIDNCKPALLIYDDRFIEKISHRTDLKGESFLDLSRAIESESPAFESVVVEDDDPIFILYTSGTTGFPKGAIYTYKMLFWNSINTTMSLALTPDDHTINCMPAFHTGGWNVLLTPMLHRGATVGILRKFDADKLLQLLEEKRSTLFMGVPTMLKMMQDTKSFTQVNLDSIRYFIVGGEALPLPVIKSWHKKGVSIRQGYGLTEVGPNLTSLHQDDAEQKQGSIGRPNYYLSTKLVDEDGHEVQRGEIGEFCLKGEVVTPGYWQNEQATKDAKEDGWFKTGDLMKQDEEGFLYVVDRKKCMFISGGENVYPAEVEKVLLELPEVEEAAVIGVPDAKWGEVGKAFLVTSPHCDLDSVAKHCIAKLAKFKVPKYFENIEVLPKNDSGKIDRKALKEHLK
ncbi:o-succinylbenzoate--CoA ligase [Fulvivirga sp. RKSG066]|uniref:o-succinylbenzoate--CoA ligase n=1 Tax=Fulvivirga aurantia TaxID=2529383 RepID=UPI0012BC9CEF|nr:o-succinylbenzoate--CoA ligase [Fulvivirga aurantia]MTI22859.1 o-succinylbenzoate--CoA ligase [Fulvivirga aurantia]